MEEDLSRSGASKEALSMACIRTLVISLRFN